MHKIELFAFSVERNAWDLHLSAGLPNMMRVDRSLNVDTPQGGFIDKYWLAHLMAAL
jgi:Tfp pilus assembly pilus retraction ATPase PilT